MLQPSRDTPCGRFLCRSGDQSVVLTFFPNQVEVEPMLTFPPTRKHSHKSPFCVGLVDEREHTRNDTVEGDQYIHVLWEKVQTDHLAHYLGAMKGRTCRIEPLWTNMGESPRDSVFQIQAPDDYASSAKLSQWKALPVAGSSPVLRKIQR